jgi:hypothetical protein
MSLLLLAWPFSGIAAHCYMLDREKAWRDPVSYLFFFNAAVAGPFFWLVPFMV